MMPVIPGKTYEHVKTGNLYKVIAIAKDSKTLADFVVYESLYENQVSKFWIRPLESFTGNALSPDGIPHPRFREVGK